jgi:hypothetical protein
LPFSRKNHCKQKNEIIKIKDLWKTTPTYPVKPGITSKNPLPFYVSKSFVGVALFEKSNILLDKKGRLQNSTLNMRPFAFLMFIQASGKSF